MATYTGALTANGLPELAEEGEIDFPAMTPRRALHVTLRDAAGSEVVIPKRTPGDAPDNPVFVSQPDGDELHAKLDKPVELDLSRLPNRRLPVDNGNPPITGAVAVTNFPAAPVGTAPQPVPGESYDLPAIVEQIDGDRLHVKVDNAVRPDLSAFGGRLPVDIGQLIPPATVAPLPSSNAPVAEVRRPGDAPDNAASVEQEDGNKLHVRIDGYVDQLPSLVASERGVIVSTSAVRLATINVTRKSILITNNGTGTLYVGKTSAVTSSGPTVGRSVPTTCAYFDSDGGRWLGELWGIYSAIASAENVSVDDCS